MMLPSHSHHHHAAAAPQPCLRRPGPSPARCRQLPAPHASRQCIVEHCTVDTWRRALTAYGNAQRPPVVALGKFDALHRGHFSLAAAAVQLGGTPVLVSFTGMAEVLGWPQRSPLVAPCDRARVLHLWSQQLSAACGHAARAPWEAVPAFSTSPGGGSSSSSSWPPAGHAGAPSGMRRSSVGSSAAPPDLCVCQRYVPFSEVRGLSPTQFVEVLARELQPVGVVAGINYRFGYRAAGDAAALRRLAAAEGLAVSIVELVGAGEPGSVGVVSSSKIRDMLATGRVDSVRKCLGRHYRLVAEFNPSNTSASSSCTDGRHHQPQPSSSDSSSSSATNGGPGSMLTKGTWHPPTSSSSGRWFVPKSCCCNEVPGPGVYSCHVDVHAGASASSNLLQLDQQDAGPSSQDSSRTTTARGDLHRQQQQQQQQQLQQPEPPLAEVHVTQDGLLLPDSCMGGALGGRSALVVLDFVHCTLHLCKTS